MIEIREQRGRGDTPFLHRTLTTLAGADDLATFDRAVVLTVGALFEHDSRATRGATYVDADVVAALLGLHVELVVDSYRALATRGLVQLRGTHRARPSIYVVEGADRA